MGCKIAKNGITISIHALLAESDSAIWVQRQLYTNFYPRSPCGERQERKALIADVYIFLSTLSLRRATVFGFTWLASRSYFYPRSPCGERPFTMTTIICTVSFLSTLSLRRATVHYDNYNLHCVISIHALLAESDTLPQKGCHHQGISIHALLAESDDFLLFPLE